MNRTFLGISLLFIATIIYVGKLITTAILVASNDIVNSVNFAVMLEQLPNSIDISIGTAFIIGSILIVLEEFLKFKTKKASFK